MKREPARGDTCAQCGNPMPAVTKTMRKYCGEQIDRDCFCSTGCCRVFHKQPDPVSSYVSFDPPERLLAPCGTESSYSRGCRCDACKAEASRMRAVRRARVAA